MGKAFKYIVKPEDGVVVAILEGVAADVLVDLGYIKKPSQFADFYDVAGEVALDLLISHSYKGVARLQKGDKWDENFGKLVASRKAFNKYNKAKQKVVKKLEKDLETTLHALIALRESYPVD